MMMTQATIHSDEYKICHQLTPTLTITKGGGAAVEHCQCTSCLLIGGCVNGLARSELECVAAMKLSCSGIAR